VVCTGDELPPVPEGVLEIFGAVAVDVALSLVLTSAAELTGAEADGCDVGCTPCEGLVLEREARPRPWARCFGGRVARRGGTR
jgi:hypothetical protein